MLAEVEGLRAGTWRWSGGGELASSLQILENEEGSGMAFK